MSAVTHAHGLTRVERMAHRRERWRRLASVGGQAVRTAAPEVGRAVARGRAVGAQLGGAAAALVGLCGLTGPWWTLLAGGLAALTVGTLAEMAGPKRGGG